MTINKGKITYNALRYVVEYFKDFIILFLSKLKVFPTYNEFVFNASTNIDVNKINSLENFFRLPNITALAPVTALT